MRTRLNLNAGPRADAGQQSHVQRIRRALGSVAARNPAVFWLYPDQSGAWWVRREGDEVKGGSMTESKRVTSWASRPRVAPPIDCFSPMAWATSPWIHSTGRSRPEPTDGDERDQR